jgi:hypothetical protein
MTIKIVIQVIVDVSVRSCLSFIHLVNVLFLFYVEFMFDASNSIELPVSIWNRKQITNR